MRTAVIWLGCLVISAGCAAPPTPARAAPDDSASTPVSSPASSLPTVRSIPGAAPPRPRTTTLPYSADWSTGTAGWATTRGWAIRDGMLVSDGESRQERAGASAPIEIDASAFAVEAEIRIARYRDAGQRGGRASFGVMARIQRDGNGYGAGHCYSLGRYVPVCAGGQQGEHRAVLWVSDRATLHYGQFAPGDGWHTYRLELRTNRFTFLIDGRPVLDGLDNSYRTGGHVGVWSNRAVIDVRRFTVVPL